MAEDQGQHPAGIVLVAVDGSPLAQAAAGVAIQLAQAEDLAIRGLYVVDERLVMDPYARSDHELGISQRLTSRPELIARFKERGDAALSWLEVSCREAHVQVSAELLLGAVPELVVQAARDVELVAVGRRGLGHASEAEHLGRNLRAIAHAAPCPILIGGDERRPITRLLVVDDPSRRSQRALVWAAVFQRMLASPAIVLAPQQDDLSSHRTRTVPEFDAHLQANGLLSYRLVPREGSLATDIIAGVTMYDASLIVIGQRSHGGWSRSQLGSVLDEVLRKTSSPLLLA